MPRSRFSSRITRRTLLVGGGLGAGLVIAWGLWPRSYEPNLRAAPGETLFNAFLKIARDGRVIVAVPQAELGQGVYTSLPQILADELGADWRTVSVEPAPIHPLYANQLLAEQNLGIGLPSAFQGIGRWAAREYATRSALMLTGGSSSVRAFEPRMREAGAAARALLSMAAAERWDAEWERLDTANGFVVNGKERIAFGELAEEAAGHDLPANLPVRGGVENRLLGKSLPRIDLPSKVDGTAQFAGDVRLPEMVFASVMAGPIGDSRLLRVDRAAAEKVPGLLRIFEHELWAGAVATNWWAADKAVRALRPGFRTHGAVVETPELHARMVSALQNEEGTRFYGQGDIEAAFAGGGAVEARYSAGVAPNAPLETLTATARWTGTRLEVWAPTQAPGLARAAAARAGDVPEGQVTVYPMLIGGGYGRKIETAAIEQAVHMAKEMKRPVQLVWSRAEETIQDSFRPPAAALIRARVAEGGLIAGWHARIAAPPVNAQVIGRLTGGTGETEAEGAAVDGAVPPYAIPAVAVDHLVLDTGLRTGIWRSGAHSYTAFFTESFVDELARKAGIEPLSYRMGMLLENPRLARVLSTAAALAGWDGGGKGSIMGLAAHSAFGSHAALVLEANVGEDQRIRVSRAVCAVDCGRVVNPDIVKQLVEGGIIYGIAGATGTRINFKGGLPTVRSLRGMGLRRLADSPEVTVEIIESQEEPGGVTELAVPVVAPAIANAIFASTGQRLRSIPLAMGSA
jgi:isoquinoline 1-oxidoreductase beta subunit